MGTVRYTPQEISEDELSSIALLGPHLKRLTLSRFCIENGLFLEHILKSCNQLESLRLSSLDRSGKSHRQCCYAPNLVSALPFAKKLKTFWYINVKLFFLYLFNMFLNSLFQSNVSQIDLLLDSLESCTSISRLSLACPSFDSFWEISKQDFSSRMIQLCDKLSQLVALFCYFNLPFEHCKEASHSLKKRFKTELRPAFCVDVQSMLKPNGEYADNGQYGHSYTSKEFPVMYNDLLTSCQSRVALVPFNCNTFLRRTY